MTQVTIAPHWSPVALGNIKGWVTLTRFTDTANNSDKYRRFILLSAPSEQRWLLLTQTGRWTHLTARNDWGGGTYSFKKVANPTAQGRAQRNGASTSTVPETHYLGEEVTRGKGQYGVIRTADAMSTGDIRLALEKCKNLQVQFGGQAPAPVAAAAPEQPKPASTPEKLAYTGDLAARVSTLGLNTDRGVDSFELMADLAVIRSEFAIERDRVEKLGAHIEAIQQHIFNAL